LRRAGSSLINEDRQFQRHNGINGRLSVLLRWLADAKSDIVCLQELKASQDKFPIAAVRETGYGAIWHGQKSWNGVTILARGSEPIEIRRGLPGDPDDMHSRMSRQRSAGYSSAACTRLTVAPRSAVAVSRVRSPAPSALTAQPD
jgi:exonuclease III